MASSEGWITGYRIVAPRWTATAFSGEGAAKYGGRWNSPGRRVVYLAGSRALAALEMLVHLTSPASRAKPFNILEARFPGSEMLAATGAESTVENGDAWLRSGRSLALRVPSALIPDEPNYLINPTHPDFAKLKTGVPVGFRFDPRL